MKKIKISFITRFRDIIYNWLTILLILTSSIGSLKAQCDLKPLNDSVLTTSSAEIGGGNSLAYFYILKSGNDFVLKLEYARGFAKKMETTPETPLVFVFEDQSEVKLFPLAKSETEAGFDIKYKYAYIGASEITSLYAITKAQLEQLVHATPLEINFYYFLKNQDAGSAREKEIWQLLHYDWHYKRMIKIVSCALENTE